MQPLSTEEFKKRVNILMGEACLKLQRLNDAYDAFKVAGDDEGLSKCAEMFFERGLLPEAVSIFRDLGDKIGLSKCAELQIIKGNLDDALQIFSEIVLLEERDLALKFLELPDSSGK